MTEACDGFIFSGGADITPCCYGEMAHPLVGDTSLMLDRSQIGLIRRVIKARKPFVAICRGHQVLNVACGGTLYQDLEKEGGFEHHFGDKYPRNVAWHKVSIAKDSILEKTYGNREIRVNSFHHQAIKDAGENVRITAWSEDRVPEAMELEDHPFAVAVQWHPEMMYDSSEQMKLLQAFVKAAEKGTEA